MSNQAHTRYIVPRHCDYWEEVHGIDEKSPSYLEFNCYTDEESARSCGDPESFYHFDLGNLNAAREIEFEQYKDRIKDPTQFEEIKLRASEQIDRLERGEISHFIEWLFFEGCDEGDFFLSPCPEGKTLFDLSHKGRSYYAYVFVREDRRLTPDVLCEIMEKYSPAWFGDECHYEAVE